VERAGGHPRADSLPRAGRYDGHVLIDVTGATDPAGEAVAVDPALADAARESVLRILGDNVLCAVASVGPDAGAHVHTAYFCVAADLALYFLAPPAALHARNLDRTTSAALAVYASTQRWGGPDRGLQLFGACAPATRARADEAERLYASRFPEYARWRSRGSAPEPARAYRFYRFVPRTLKVIDEAALGDGVFVHAEVRPGGRRAGTLPRASR
jgi:uncharacterized protein YhbP (UPF0306 family)